MKNKLLLFTIFTFLVSACDFEIKCLDCTTETITFKTSEEKKKVNEALGVLNELFDESFEKSNIEKIIPMQDKEGKPLLKILKFKKKGYALISDIKNVDNPAVLFFSKSKFDKDHPGFKVYVSEFKATAARDTLNAILPSSKEFRDKMKKIMKKPKATKKNLKNLPKSYGYGGYGNYGSHNRPTHPASRGIIETFPGDCYDSYGNMKYCSNYCIWEQRTYCGHNSCGAGICYDKKGNLKQKGYYRKKWKVSEFFSKKAHQKGPLLKTYWRQSPPYGNTVREREGPYPVGCVAVAVGQIMAYHKKTKFASRYDYSYWKYIHQTNLTYDDNNKGKDGFYYLKNYKDESLISKLLWYVAEGVDMNYAKDGSGSTDTNAVKYFEDAGYSIPGGNWGWRWDWDYWSFFDKYYPDIYDYSVVVYEIDNNRPVYLSGDRGPVAHAWVADGHRIAGYKKTYRNEKGYYDYGNIRNKSVYDDKFIITTEEYIHMNWGWGSGQYRDGWCTYDYWKASDTKNYQYNKRMIKVHP